MNTLNQIENNVTGAMSKGLPALKRMQQELPRLTNQIAMELLEETISAGDRQSDMDGMPDTTASILDRKQNLPGASVRSPMSPGIAMQDRNIAMAQQRPPMPQGQGGLPQLASPNMARMAGGGIVAFQEGGSISNALISRLNKFTPEGKIYVRTMGLDADGNEIEGLTLVDQPMYSAYIEKDRKYIAPPEMLSGPPEMFRGEAYEPPPSDGQFEEAFAKARAEGKDKFMWRGKPYHTKYAEEMASGGVVGFQEGGMAMSDAEAIAKEMMVIRQQMDKGDKSEEALRQLQARLNELNTQMTADTTGNLRANVYQTMDRMQGREPDEGMYGGGKVKRYQTGDYVEAPPVVARHKDTGALLTADDITYMRQIGQEDLIVPYNPLLEGILGEDFASSMGETEKAVSGQLADAFEGRNISTDASVLENLGDILGGTMEAAPGTVFETGKGALKMGRDALSELFSGIEPGRVVGENIPEEAKEEMEKRRLLSQLRREARGEGEYFGEEDAGMVDGEFDELEFIKDYYGKLKSAVTSPELVDWVNQNFPASTPVEEGKEGEGGVTRDEEGKLKIEINKGDKDKVDEKKKFNWDALFDLGTKLGAGAGASSGFEGQKYLQTRQAQDLAEQLLGLETAAKEREALIKLYPELQLEAEQAWVLKEKELEEKAGAGLFNLLTDAEEEEIARQREPFIQDYISRRSKQVLGGAPTTGSVVTDYSNYRPE